MWKVCLHHTAQLLSWLMKRNLFKGSILPSKLFTRCFLLLFLEHLVDLILCRLTYAGADVAVKLEEEPSGLPLKVITKYMLCSPISMYCLKPWMPFDNKSRVWHSIDEKSWISVFGSDHNTMEVLTFICPSFGRCWKSFPIWQGIIVCGYLQVPMPRNWSSLN